MGNLTQKWNCFKDAITEITLDCRKQTYQDWYDVNSTTIVNPLTNKNKIFKEWQD